MKYLELFLAFLKVGLISFGGGYAGIPLIRETVLSHGWMTDDAVSYFVAVSESTPGPIMVNAATYVGSIHGGVFGAIIATLGVILPSFVIILLVCVALKHFLENKVFQSILGGIKPSIAGVILATGIVMLVNNIFADGAIDLIAVIIGAVLTAIILLYKKYKKKKFSPIATIGIAALLGAVLYGIV